MALNIEFVVIDREMRGKEEQKPKNLTQQQSFPLSDYSIKMKMNRKPKVVLLCCVLLSIGECVLGERRAKQQ